MTALEFMKDMSLSTDHPVEPNVVLFCMNQFSENNVREITNPLIKANESAIKVYIELGIKPEQSCYKLALEARKKYMGL